MADLTQLITKNGDRPAVLRLRHPSTDEELVEKLPDGSKRYVTLQLLGNDSDTFKKVSRTITDKKLERQLRRGRKAVKMTAAELEEDQMEILVACTVGWENIELEGKPLEYSKENARRLYELLPWAREQADDFIGDRTQFLGN